MNDLVIMLGDSLTAAKAWDQAFPKAQIRNMGENGDTCPGVWIRLPEVIELQPAQVFLMIGINDLLRGAWPDEIITGHLRLWSDLKDKSPRTKLHVLSILPYLEASLPGLPSNLDIRLLNMRLQEEAEAQNINFIDLFSLLADPDLQLELDYTSDGLHLTPEAYEIWADQIRPLVEA